MIIQWLLSAALCVLGIYAVSQQRSAPLVASGILASVFAGLIVVGWPEIASYFAQKLGVGRGVDLILYIFIVIVLAAILNLHLKIRSTEQVLTQLARELAIRDARRPDAGDP